MSEPFNPLDISSLAHSIVTRMEEREPTPLSKISRFVGAGLYAIYYTGQHAAYALLADRNSDDRFEEPIYVGKAVPAGSRRGLEAPSQTTRVLFRRLGEHVTSIGAVANLNIEDFWARWVVLEDIWIPLGESAMLRRYRPVWNAIVDGFGNHDPGAGRRAGKRSRWDTLHPGRRWSGLFPARDETATQIEQDVTEYLRSRLG